MKTPPKKSRPEKPSTNGSNGKGKDGRFLPGNPGGPGNPFVQEMAKFRSFLFSHIKVKDFEGMLDKAVGEAKRGNMIAFKILAEYLLGQPKGEFKLEIDNQTNDSKPVVDLYAMIEKAVLAKHAMGILPNANQCQDQKPN